MYVYRVCNGLPSKPLIYSLGQSTAAGVTDTTGSLLGFAVSLAVSATSCLIRKCIIHYSHTIVLTSVI